MAGQAYAEAEVCPAIRAARRLVALSREKELLAFTARDMLRAERYGLTATAELNPALAAPEDANCIRPVEDPARPKGGRPLRCFIVNPALLGGLPGPFRSRLRNRRNPGDKTNKTAQNRFRTAVGRGFVGFVGCAFIENCAL